MRHDGGYGLPSVLFSTPSISTDLPETKPLLSWLTDAQNKTIITLHAYVEPVKTAALTVYLLPSEISSHSPARRNHVPVQPRQSR